MKKQAPRHVTVAMTSKIGPNDLKTKLAKVKSELGPERRVSKVFVEISCAPNEMDQANALLLSVQKMFEGSLQVIGKPVVRRRNEKEETSEIMDEDQVLEAMENPESLVETAKNEKMLASAPKITVTFRQEYSNPAFTNQVAKEKEESKESKQAKEFKTPTLVLNDEEISALVDREFAKVTSKTINLDTDTVAQEENHERMARMFQIEDKVDFEQDVGLTTALRLNPAFKQRVFEKLDRLKMIDKGIIVTKKAVSTKKEKKVERPTRSSKVLKKLGSSDMVSRKRAIEEESGLVMDRELLGRSEQWTRTDPTTRQRLISQKEIIKKL